MYCRPGGPSNRLLLPRAFPPLLELHLLLAQFPIFPPLAGFSINDGVPCGNALGQFPPAVSAVDQALIPFRKPHAQILVSTEH